MRFEFISIRLKVCQIDLMFVANSLQIRFKLASNSFQIRFSSLSKTFDSFQTLFRSESLCLTMNRYLAILNFQKVKPFKVLISVWKILCRGKPTLLSKKYTYTWPYLWKKKKKKSKSKDFLMESLEFKEKRVLRKQIYFTFFIINLLKVAKFLTHFLISKLNNISESLF